MSVLEKVKTDELEKSGVVEECLIPDVDILERDNSWLLIANIPGADNGSTEVSLDNDLLAIRATLRNELPEGYTACYTENKVNRYSRSFRLPDGVDRDGIAALLKDGVLRVTLPKAKEALPRKIKVNSN